MRRLFTLKSLPAWLLSLIPLWKPFYNLLEGIHNLDFVLAARENPRLIWVWHFLTSQVGTFLVMVMGLGWLAYIVMRKPADQTKAKAIEAKPEETTTQQEGEQLKAAQAAWDEEKHQLERQLRETEQESRSEKSLKEGWEKTAKQHEAKTLELQERLQPLELLAKLAEEDRGNVGAGVKITGCEVDIDMDLESMRGWVEYRFKVFNGSVFPISVVNDLGGFVSFSNMQKIRKLDEEPKMLPQVSSENCQRHNIGHFTIRQELSKEDVAFISAANSGCFIFEKLVISVRGRGEAFEGLPATPLATQADDVQPTLRVAFRHDQPAIEARRKARDARLHALIFASGISAQVYRSLDRAEHGIERTITNYWENDTIEALRKGYGGHDEARNLFESLSSKYPIDEANISDQRRWVGEFCDRLRKLIDQERQINP